MNTNPSSTLSIDLFSKKNSVSGLLSSDQLLQEADILADISSTPQQQSVPSNKIEKLAHHLQDRIPFLKLVDFELTQLSGIQAIGSMTMSNSRKNSPDTIEIPPRLQILTVASYLAAITLTIRFPQAYIVIQDSVSDAPSLVFLKPRVLTNPVSRQGNRLHGRCSIDQDALLDQQIIFQDRGQCEIPMYVQFFFREDLMAYASPTIALYRDSWSSSDFPDTFKNGHSRAEVALWKSEGEFKKEAVNLATENEVKFTESGQRAGHQCWDIKTMMRGAAS